jgi:hypothetical protein
MKYAAEMGLRSHDIHSEFHKDWFKHSKVKEDGGYTDSTEIA